MLIKILSISYMSYIERCIRLQLFDKIKIKLLIDNKKKKTITIYTSCKNFRKFELEDAILVIHFIFNKLRYNRYTFFKQFKGHLLEDMEYLRYIGIDFDLKAKDIIGKAFYLPDSKWEIAYKL